MARIEINILGVTRGKVGGVVAKVRNGKPYLASLPSKYTPSQKPQEIDKRNKFRVNGKFAKSIKETGILYRVWDKEKAPASNAYNKICKVNFKLCNADRPSEKNVITPDGFDLPVKGIKSYKDRIEAELAEFKIGNKEKRLILKMIVCFYNPKQNGMNFFELRSIENLEPDWPTFIFKFNAKEIQLSNTYKNKTVYLAVVTESDKGEIIRFSKTAAKMF